MGVPGSGKDTQAKLLETNLGYKIIRIGHLIRQLAKADPALDRTQKHGDLAGEKLVNHLMSDAIDAQPDDSTMVSDGYPRSLSQAQYLEEMCKAKNIKFLKVIYLHIPNDESVKRLKLRNRVDDTDDTIHNRLEIFSKTTSVVVEYFRSKGYLAQIDGMGTVEQVYSRVEGVLR